MQSIMVKLRSAVIRRISCIKWQCVPWLLVAVFSLASPLRADITNDVSGIKIDTTSIRQNLLHLYTYLLSDYSIQMWDFLDAIYSEIEPFDFDPDLALYVDDPEVRLGLEGLFNLVDQKITDGIIDSIYGNAVDIYDALLFLTGLITDDGRLPTDPAIDWVQGKADLSGLVVELGDVDNDIWGQLENTTLHVDLGADAEVTAHVDNWDEFEYSRWNNVFGMASSMLGTGIFDNDWDFNDSGYYWQGAKTGANAYDINNARWRNAPSLTSTDWFTAVYNHLNALVENGEERHHTALATLFALTGTNGQAAVQNQVENQMDSLSSAESEFNSVDFTDRMMPDRQGGLYKGLTEGRFVEKTDWMREYQFKLPDVLTLDFGTWEYGIGASSQPLVLYHEFDVKNSGLADGFEMLRQCSRFLWWLATVWLLWRTWCLVIGVLLKIYNVFMQSSHLS